MNSSCASFLKFAKSRAKKGFTHLDYNSRNSSTASTARLSDLRAMGYVFRETVIKVGDTKRKKFWLIGEPKCS